MLPMMMPSSAASSYGGVSASTMAIANPMQQMQQFMAQMAPQSAFMPYPFMTPHGYPAVANMQTHSHQQQMHIPSPLTVSAPAASQAQRHLSIPNPSIPPSAVSEPPREVVSPPASMFTSTALQQQTSTLSSSSEKSDDANEYDSNKKSDSTNLAHCA